MDIMDMSFWMSLVGLIGVARQFLPPEVMQVLREWWEKLIRPANLYSNFRIPEYIDDNTNNLYRISEAYLRASNLCSVADNLVLRRRENEKEITYNLGGGESVRDTFDGVTVWWSRNIKGPDKDSDEEVDVKEFNLKMRKRDRQFVMRKYLENVAAIAEEYKRQQRKLYLYSNNDCYWKLHNFKHPSTFDSLAMEPELKDKLKTDLQSFMDGEQFFRKVGRAWKRGYLLYGPPGTGKSSLIAAMANYLKYNIYDLELTQVYNNNYLKQLLVNTTSKSIIVIEDIDCSLDLTGDRKVEPPAMSGKKSGVSGGDNKKVETNKVTLSGLLNFTDGLWSCCGDERIIVFTTNHVEKLDAALLRPGRMDMHIHMSYCSFETFKALASNYLSINSHPLYYEVKSLLEGGALVTPAHVTEYLFGNKDDPKAAIEVLITQLKRKPEEEKKLMSEENKELEVAGSANLLQCTKNGGFVEVADEDTEPKKNSAPEKTANGISYSATVVSEVHNEEVKMANNLKPEDEVGEMLQNGCGELLNDDESVLTQNLVLEKVTKCIPELGFTDLYRTQGGEAVS